MKQVLPYDHCIIEFSLDTVEDCNGHFVSEEIIDRLPVTEVVYIENIKADSVDTGDYQNAAVKSFCEQFQDKVIVCEVGTETSYEVAAGRKNKINLVGQGLLMEDMKFRDISEYFGVPGTKQFVYSNEAGISVDCDFYVVAMGAKMHDVCCSDSSLDIFIEQFADDEQVVSRLLERLSALQPGVKTLSSF